MSTRTLMYHGLDSAEYPSELTEPGDLLYVLAASEFSRHLTWLQNDGWRIDTGATTTANPDTRAHDRDAKRCVLTFDDGHVTNHQLALPMLKDAGVQAVFFITTDRIGTPYSVTEAMLREMHEAGMVIGAHGASHQFLTDMSEADATRELDTSKKRLEDILGHEVTTMSAPGGRVDKRVTAIAAALGYTDMHTSDTEPAFSLPGVTVHGRLAVKRGYDMARFERMMRTGLPPESALRTRGLAVAKRVLGNERYQRLRAAALKALARRGQ